ncbi:MAG: photosynthetic reaction center subunit H [Pseudomonadota bacterium]
MTESFFGNFDLAQLTLYLFWIFFAGLVYYLQLENMREGYPLEEDDGSEATNQGPFPVPGPKTFRLWGGRGEVTVPTLKPEDRTLALRRSSAAEGSPFEPTGDPMADGVGPASWAPRKDEPELDAHLHPKIQPMRSSDGFALSAGPDPRGLPVLAGDRQVVGEISDIWLDVPEQLVRYLEIKLDKGGSRLVPITLAVVKSNHVRVGSIFSSQFQGVPKIKDSKTVTKLEEDKISAYYCGGKLYAGNRAEPALH